MNYGALLDMSATSSPTKNATTSSELLDMKLNERNTL